MRFKTVSSPHRISSSSISKVMLKVLAALLPGTAAMIYFFGWGVVTNLLLAIPLALIGEATILAIRKRPLKPALSDLSIVVTAWLLALAIPAASPIWLIAVGILFATIFGKQLYGGLGYNPFNPAMVGYVVLLISFPLQMSQWPSADSISALSLIDTLRYISSGELPLTIDGITGATALDYSKTQLSQNVVLSSINDNPVFGQLGSTHWEWVGLAYLIGGIALIVLKVMPWHTPVAMLASLFIIASIFNLMDGERYADGLFHLFSGGAMLGAFFIITDPVSGCTSNRGRLIFGALVGLLVYIIRSWGGYPDGIAFAVLLANMCAPMIDYYSKPRVFGTQSKPGSGAKRG